MIAKWQKILDLSDWEIVSKEIDRSQVVFPDNISPVDRYFTGISMDGYETKATIYHDDELTEEAVIHELLHLKFPDKDEDWVNSLTVAVVGMFCSNGKLEI